MCIHTSIYIYVSIDSLTSIVSLVKTGNPYVEHCFIVFKATFCIASAPADLVWISSAATAIFGLQQHLVHGGDSNSKM